MFSQYVQLYYLRIFQTLQEKTKSKAPVAEEEIDSILANQACFCQYVQPALNLNIIILTDLAGEWGKGEAEKKGKSGMFSQYVQLYYLRIFQTLQEKKSKAEEKQKKKKKANRVTRDVFSMFNFYSSFQSYKCCRRSRTKRQVWRGLRSSQFLFQLWMKQKKMIFEFPILQTVEEKQRKKANQACFRNTFNCIIFESSKRCRKRRVKQRRNRKRKRRQTG